MSGEFDTINFPDGQTWFVDYDTKNGTLTVGVCLDDDGDGVCNDDDICPGFDDNLDADNDGIPDGCDACPNRELGDVSGDGMVDINDVAPFAAVLLDPGPATPDDVCAADVNKDGAVNGLDTQGMINLLLTP